MVKLGTKWGVFGMEIARYHPFAAFFEKNGVTLF